VAERGDEEYGKAYAEASKATDAAGARVVEQIREAVPFALSRCDDRRNDGYPKDALDRLKKWAVVFKGVPGAETLDAAVKAWEKDPLFKKALAGEKEIASLEAQNAPKPAWEALLKKYAGTCLETRLKAKIE
jgi:hypothetical protein